MVSINNVITSDVLEFNANALSRDSTHIHCASGDWGDPFFRFTLVVVFVVALTGKCRGLAGVSGGATSWAGALGDIAIALVSGLSCVGGVATLVYGHGFRWPFVDCHSFCLVGFFVKSFVAGWNRGVVVVGSVTNFSRNGLSDWLWQRVSAVVFLAYCVMLCYAIFSTPGHNFEHWHAWFMQPWMRVFTLLALLSVLIHAWVGIWTVLTDYIKLGFLRLIMQCGMIGLLFVYLIWGATIVF